MQLSLSTRWLVLLLILCNIAGAYQATPPAPSKEYIRLNGRVIAIESTAPQGGGFSLEVNPATLSINRGASRIVTVSISRSSGYTGDVTLTYPSLPAGVTVSPTTTTLSGSTASATIEVAVAASVATGSVNLTVQAQGVGIGTPQSKVVPINVTADPGILLSGQTSLSVAQGRSASIEIGVAAVNGFSGTVSFTASSVTAGLAGSFSVSSVAPPLPGATMLSVQPSSSVLPGVHTVKVTASGTSGGTAVQVERNYTVTVVGFSFSGLPATMSVDSNTTPTIQLTVDRGNLPVGEEITFQFTPPSTMSGMTFSFPPYSTTATSIKTAATSITARIGGIISLANGTSGALTITGTSDNASAALQAIQVATSNVTITAPSGPPEKPNTTQTITINQPTATTTSSSNFVLQLTATDDSRINQGTVPDGAKRILGIELNFSSSFATNDFPNGANCRVLVEREYGGFRLQLYSATDSNSVLPAAPLSGTPGSGARNNNACGVDLSQSTVTTSTAAHHQTIVLNLAFFSSALPSTRYLWARTYADSNGSTPAYYSYMGRAWAPPAPAVLTITDSKSTPGSTTPPSVVPGEQITLTLAASSVQSSQVLDLRLVELNEGSFPATGPAAGPKSLTFSATNSGSTRNVLFRGLLCYLNCDQPGNILAETTKIVVVLSSASYPPSLDFVNPRTGVSTNPLPSGVGATAVANDTSKTDVRFGVDNIQYAPVAVSLTAVKHVYLSVNASYLNSAITQDIANGCRVSINANSGSTTTYDVLLHNDNGIGTVYSPSSTAWVPGSATSWAIENSQCKVEALPNSSTYLEADSSGSFLLVGSLKFTFKRPFSGERYIFMKADRGDGPSSMWQYRGPLKMLNPATSVTVSSVSAPISASSQNITVSANVVSPSTTTVAGGTVTFRVTNGSGTQIGSSVTSSTVAGGAASATYVLPANTAIGSYVLRAIYNGNGTLEQSPEATNSFTVAGGNPAQITINGGSSQSATVSAAFANPLQVTVKDSLGNVLPGVTVTFTGPATGASTNPASTTSVTNGSGVASATVTANATAGGPYQVVASTGAASTAVFSLTNNPQQWTVLVTTNMNGPQITVDGGTAFTGSSPSLTWAGGSNHTLASTSPQSFATGSQYLFVNWAHGGAMNQTVTPTANTTYTANFKVQHQLTTTASTGGSISPASAYTDSGNVTITATPNTGYTFAGFSGAVNATTSPQTYNLTAPATVNALFVANTSTAVTSLSPLGYSPSSRTLNVAATVTSAAGTVSGSYVIFTLLDGSNNTVASPVASSAITNGAASAVLNLPAALAPGSYTVRASFEGNAAFGLSTGTTPFVIQALTTTTTTTGATVTSSTSAQNVSLSAQVAASSAVNAGTVTFTLRNGATVIGSPVTSGAVAAGAATATYSLPANTAAATYTLTAVYNASSGYATSQGTANIVVQAGAAASVTASSGTGQSAVISTAFTNPLSVTVRDAVNNPVSGATVNFTGPGSGAGIASTVSATTNASGVASASVTANGTTGGPYNVTASVAGATSATFSLTNSPNTISITVGSNLAASKVSVDGGTAFTGTQTFNWTPGSSHTIAATSPQSGGTGIQYAFLNWSDSGAMSHTVAPTTATTYTANFKTQYQLTTSASTGGSISPASGFYDAGNVTVTATPSAGFTFSGFSGALTGATNPRTLNLTGPATVSASFQATSTTTVGTVPTIYSIYYTQNITQTATVTSGGTPITVGTVTFSILNSSNTVIATSSAAALNGSGVASGTLSVPANTPIGTYTMRASYSGSGPYPASVGNASFTTKVQISISPSATQTAWANDSRDYTATVSSGGVTWSRTPAVGTMTPISNQLLFAAPSSIASSQTVTIRATSTLDSGSYAEVQLTLLPGTPTPAVLSQQVNSLNNQKFNGTITLNGIGSTTSIGFALVPPGGTIGAASSCTMSLDRPSVGTTNWTATLAAGTVVYDEGQFIYQYVNDTCLISPWSSDPVMITNANPRTVTFLYNGFYLYPSSGTVFQVYTRLNGGSWTSAGTWTKP